MLLTFTLATLATILSTTDSVFMFSVLALEFAPTLQGLARRFGLARKATRALGAVDRIVFLVRVFAAFSVRVFRNHLGVVLCYEMYILVRSVTESVSIDVVNKRNVVD